MWTDNSLFTAVVLLFAAMGILFLELLLPSAGMLFVLALSCIAASLWFAYKSGPVAFWSFMFTVMALAVVLPPLGFRLWKRSPVGRRLMLGTPSDEAPDDDDLARAQREMESLLGQVGKTVTPLRPSGITEFLGRRVDTVAEGVMIERGAWVKVVIVQGNRVVVRPMPKNEFEKFAT